MIFAEAQMEEEFLRVEQADLSWGVEQADLLHSFLFLHYWRESWIVMVMSIGQSIDSQPRWEVNGQKI